MFELSVHMGRGGVVFVIFAGSESDVLQIVLESYPSIENGLMLN